MRRRLPPPGRRAAGAREPPAPSERDERAAHCRLGRRGERGIARAAGARRARWSRHLSPPPGCRSEEAARAAGARRARRCAPFAATAAGPLGRGRCLRRRSEESAPVAPPMPSPRRWSKGTTPVAPPFAAAALPGRWAAGAREPPAPGGGKMRCALPPQSPLRRPRRGERGIRPRCRSEKSAQGAPPVPAAKLPSRKAAGSPAPPELGEGVGCAASLPLALGRRAAGASEVRRSRRLCCLAAVATEARRSRRLSPLLRRRVAGARELPAPPERGECVGRAAFAATLPEQQKHAGCAAIRRCRVVGPLERGSRLHRRSEKSAPRAAASAAIRGEESEGSARAAGARRARRARHLSLPPSFQAARLPERASRLRRRS